MKPRATLAWFGACVLTLWMAGGVGAESASSARATGDQQREYAFAPTGQKVPYRIYVPQGWDGRKSLPIVLFLHGAGANERTYLDLADGQVRRLAEQHGYIVVSVLGFSPLGAYGNPLRLPAVFGRSDVAEKQRAEVTPERQRELDLSELDVMTVLEIVTEEYGADRSRTFLAGHSMGSGGVWHLAERYPERWKAIAPMSGPFVDRDTYSFERLRDLPILMTEGTGAAPSLEGSRAMAKFMQQRGYRIDYEEVDGNHGGMVPMVWPRVFDFFDAVSRGEDSRQATTEYRLWPDKAPGTERWTTPESQSVSPTGDRVIRNVSQPTLTAFLPSGAKANGSAVIIAPGGALRLLGFDNEGVKVARWLAERGIAAFVLKYRTLQTQGEERPPAPPAVATARRKEVVIHNANANPEPDNLALREVLAMAVTDAQAAMRLVRAHAGEWHIDPHRIGLMGFSAGGGVAVATALAPASDGSPDFLASLYGPSLQDVHVRADSPPLFIGVGSQHFNVTSGCIALFDAWRAAARPTELHVYEGVSAGFGFNARGLPVDGWKDRFLEWMAAQGLLHPAAQATTAKTH